MQILPLRPLPLGNVGTINRAPLLSYARQVVSSRHFVTSRIERLYSTTTSFSTFAQHRRSTLDCTRSAIYASTTSLISRLGTEIRIARVCSLGKVDFAMCIVDRKYRGAHSSSWSETSKQHTRVYDSNESATSEDCSVTVKW